MANEDIGEIDCTVRITGYVRRKAKGRHPLYVHDKRFGNLFFQTEQGQDEILENATIYGENGKPAEDKKPGAIYPAPAAPEDQAADDEVVTDDDLVTEQEPEKDEETGFML